MKKLNLFLLVAGFFVFSSCTERLEHNEEKSSGNVVINLSSVNAERGAVPDGYSSVDISEVKEWKLTFSLVPPFNGFPDEVRIINGKSGAVTIGVGEYDLFVEGSYTESRDTGDFIYKLSGARSGIVVEEGNKNTVPVSVLVGPKKTTEGKGSFSAEMSFEKVALSTYYKKIGISSNDTTKISKRFKAELVSRKTGETVYSTHSVDNLLVAEAVSGGSSVTVKPAQTESGPNKISSGYYYFRFYADFAPVNQNDLSAEITPDWKEVSIGDNLVEIGDGLSTSMECTSLSLPNDTPTYYYYASDDGSEENNGISLNARGELYAVLDTIYNNPMVQNAEIDYSYTNNIRFDVSKIGSGKTVEIKCKKNGEGDASTFVLESDSSMYFQNLMESITLTSESGAKGVKIKENINANSSTTISLEKGVYLDLTSLTTGESMTSVNLRLDVDDIEYYKNNPMVVSSVRFNEKLSFVCSDPSHFTYDIVEKSADSSYKYYAEEPVSPIVYYSNKYSQGSSVVQYWIQYKENPLYGDNPPSYSNNNFSLAAFCDDYNGGLYAFEFNLKGGTIVPSNPSGYELVHFVRKKTDKSTEFTLEKNNTTGYIKQQIPASMCTDGSRLYFVNTAATIAEKGGAELSLSLWNHWAYENAIVYSVVAGNSGQSASEVQLNFDSVFTKVTAVYCQGINKDLYIAGYKTNQNGSTKDSTYCIYKLANPQNYTTSVSITVEELTKVSELFTTSKDSSFIDWSSNQATQNVYAFNAITDMAIIDNNLYVLKNSYYFANADTTKITSSLIRINNGQTWSTADNNGGYQNHFMVARKFIAVLPKKKKLLISENASSCYYTGDFSNDDLNIDSMTGSVYAFDGYDIAPTGFISGEKFKSEADFIENVSSN